MSISSPTAGRFDQVIPLPFPEYFSLILALLFGQFLYLFLNIFILTAGSFDGVIPLPFPEYVLYTAGTRVVIKALIDYFGLITYSDQAFPLPFLGYFCYIMLVPLIKSSFYHFVNISSPIAGRFD